MKKLMYLLIFFLIFLILALLIVPRINHSQHQSKAEEMGEEVLKKLEAKYNEEFELESTEYIRENQSYVIFVHPKENPDMSIRVMKWSMGGYRLTDDYIVTKRFFQMTKLFEKDINSINKKKLYQVVIGNDYEMNNYYYDMRYTITEVLKNNEGNTYIIGSMYFFYDITPENREETCKKVYELIKHIQEIKPKEVSLEIFFYDEAYFKYKDVEWINKEKMGLTGMMNFDSFYLDKKKSRIVLGKSPTSTLTLDEFNKIKSYKDIEKRIWFKKFNGEFYSYGGDKEFDWVDVNGNIID